FPVHQRHRDTFMSGSTGPTNPVPVGLFVIGGLEVDDVGNFFDIDPASGHIGCDEHVDFAVSECAQGLFSSTLAEIAVECPGSETATLQFFGNSCGATLCASKDNG